MSTDAWVVLKLSGGPAVVGRVEAERDDGSWSLRDARLLGADGQLGEFDHDLDLAPGRVEWIQRLRAGEPLVVDLARGSGGSGGLAGVEDPPRDPFARWEPADVLR